VALGEALKPEFHAMNEQIVKNSRALASELQGYGFELAAGGTDNHLVLAGVGKGRGGFMQEALDIAGITLNKNTIPSEPCSPFNPSGIRMGTPIMTMRGMKEDEMKLVAEWMNEVAQEVKQFSYQETKEERKAELQKFRAHINSSEPLKKVREKVRALCLKFPIYS